MRGFVFDILVMLLLMFMFLVSISFASVYSYRWISGLVFVSSPVVYFSDPGTPNASVSLENHGTKALVTVNVPSIDLELDKRNAIFYDTFDINPIDQRIINLTCNWSWNPTAKAMQIAANRQAMTYGGECIAVADIDISQYASARRRIFVASLVWRTAFTGSGTHHFDVIYISTELSRLYTIGFRNVPQTGRTGDSITSDILYWSTTGWRTIASRSLGRSTTTEYLYLSYVTSWIDFSSWTAYHWNATLLNSGSIGSGYRFTPNYVGIGYRTSTTRVSGTVYFDNLVVTVDAYPWLVNVTNVPPGWRVVLRSAAGGVISTAIAGADGVASLNVAPPKVDLTVYPNYRDGFIIASGTIEVYDDGNNLVVLKQFDYIIGGDVYRFNGFRGYVLRIDSGVAQPFQTHLTLTQYTGCSDSYIWIYLMNTTGILSTPITIYRGFATSLSTSVIVMRRGVSGIAGYIYVVAYVPKGARCSLLMEFRYSFSNWATYGINIVNATFVGV